MRALYAWGFLVTQIGILIALWLGAYFMARIGRKLDRDHTDRELLRQFLVRASNTALAAMDAVHPATIRDDCDGS